ncbi:unnamed protein product [Cuscuta campestris]|uniref:Cell cycle checkpoint protein RAD1 n=1 Tax=Cuscuta campestris TaxID=132261 RepID=A0A484LA71_9ASTE|nr:unnamed protein product [Cuscuta campestris]
MDLWRNGSASDSRSEGCVFDSRQLFSQYEYRAEGRPRFGMSLGLFVDCLSTFSVPGKSSAIELQFPGPDMELLLKTRIPETMPWDCNFEPTGSTPISFTVKSAALKEAIDDLEWPGSSILLTLQPTPPSVTFKGQGHGDLQIDFMHRTTSDLVAFHCDRLVSYRYKYKFLQATTSNMPSSVMRDNRGSKCTIGRSGMLKVQHLVSLARPVVSLPHSDSSAYHLPSRIAYIEFFVKPEVDDDEEHNAN